MSRLMRVLAAFCLLTLASGAPAEPYLPNAPTPVASLPYRLSLGQPGARPKGSNKLAYIHSYGPLVFTDMAKAQLTLLPEANILLAVARTGKLADRHLMRCYMQGTAAIEVSQYRDTKGVGFFGPLDSDLVTRVSVKDGDDGKVDGRFSFPFYFVTDRDFVRIKNADAAVNSWMFKSCRIMIEGVGNGDDFLPPVPVNTKAVSLITFRPGSARQRLQVEGAQRFAETGLVSGMSVTPTLNEDPADYSWSVTPLAGQSSGTMVLRMVRMGTPSQQHQLRCRGNISGAKLSHFRQKPGAAANDFSEGSLFKSQPMKKVDVPNKPGISVVYYNFYFGVTGQDSLTLEFDKFNRIDMCSLSVGSQGVLTPLD